MNMIKSLHIVASKTEAEQIKQLQDDLAHADIQIIKVDSIHQVEDNQLCCLLVSDNFLKSSSCLDQLYTKLRSRRAKDTIVIKLADVNYQRTGDVIKYMGFWSDELFQILKQRRDASDDKKADIEKKEQQIKIINKEIKDVLGSLSRQPTFEFQSLRPTKYASLLQHLDFSPLMRDAFEQKLSPKNETELLDLAVPAVALQAIPGIALLDQKRKEEQNRTTELEIEAVDQNTQHEQKEKPQIEEVAIKQKHFSKEDVHLFLQQENYVDANTGFKQLIEENPNDIQTRREYASMLYHKLEQIPAAKDQYNSILEINPRHTDTHVDLGTLLVRHDQSKLDLAADHFNSAVELDPSHIDAHFELAMLQKEHFRNSNKASELFESVIQLDPTHAYALYELAGLYKDAGKSKQAAAVYNRAAQLNPMFRSATNDAIYQVAENKSKQAKPQEATKKANKMKTKKSEKTKKSKKNKTSQKGCVLITGATAGIGEAAAYKFASEGYDCILNGRREKRLKKLAKKLTKKYKTNNYILAGDVRDDLSEQISELPKVDILVNNAGLAQGLDPLQSGQLKDWDTMLDTNVKGLLRITRAVVPAMIEHGSGMIINVGSVAGHHVYPGGGVYCASKHAVRALTAGMRMDFFKHGIRVGMVSPGHVTTEFASVRYQGDQDKVEHLYRGFEPLHAADIAESIYFVACQPKHVNIQDIIVWPSAQAGPGLLDRKE